MSFWLNYHHLLYFKTIAETGTVSRAAQKLRIGQPTLSAQLKQFESNLGIQLFERKKKRLILTEHGKIALEYSKTIFKAGSEMLEALNDGVRNSKTPLHIGALDSIPKQVVFQIVRFATRSSECQVTLSEGRPEELLRELLAHRIDLVITNILPSGPDAKGLHPKSISKKNVAIYGTKAFKHLRRGFPASISGQPFIVPTHDSSLRADLEHWARLNGVELSIIVESQDIAIKKLLASHGVGIAALATHAARLHVARGDLFEIGVLQGVSEELFLLSADRTIPNPLAAKIFRSFRLS